MSAVEKVAALIAEQTLMVDKHGNALFDPAIGAEYVLSNPAVIAELFADLANDREREWVFRQMVDSWTSESMPLLTELFRRLLTQGWGRQDGHSPVETSEPATPDLLPKEESDG